MNLFTIYFILESYHQVYHCNQVNGWGAVYVNLKGCFLEVLEMKLCHNMSLGDAELIKLNKFLYCMISQNILILMCNVISRRGIWYAVLPKFM